QLRMHEARRLDARKPGRREPAGEVGAHLRRERDGVALKPVARADVADGDGRHHPESRDAAPFRPPRPADRPPAEPLARSVTICQPRSRSFATARRPEMAVRSTRALTALVGAAVLAAAAAPAVAYVCHPDPAGTRSVALRGTLSGYAVDGSTVAV